MQSNYNQFIKLPTVGDGNCFFHAVFGNLQNGEYETDQAIAMRQEWTKYIKSFTDLSDKSMPVKLRENLQGIFNYFITNNAELKKQDESIKLLSEQTIVNIENAKSKKEKDIEHIIASFRKNKHKRQALIKFVREKKENFDIEKISTDQKLKDAIALDFKGCLMAISEANELQDDKYFYERDEQYQRNQFTNNVKVYDAYSKAISSKSYYILNYEIELLASLAGVKIILYSQQADEIATQIIIPEKGFLPVGYKKASCWPTLSQQSIWHEGVHYSRYSEPAKAPPVIRQDYNNYSASATGVNMVPKSFPASIDTRLVPNYAKELTADGLRKTLHGNLYQLALLILVASRAAKQDKQFYLISEALEFEKFDDLVIDYGDRITFLQAKHSSKGELYSQADFCKDIDEDASLAKYFDSWIKLKQSPYVKNSKDQDKETRFIFFTNRTVKEGASFLEATKIEDDEFLFAGLPIQATFKFKAGDSRSPFIDAIRAHSEIIKKASTDKLKSTIDLKYYQSEVQAARKYLKGQANKSNVNEKLPINKRSKLSIKTLALIKYALTNETTQKAICTTQKLMKWFEGIKAKIDVKIDNFETILSSVMQTEIDQFLDELIIKIGQPHEKELQQILHAELGEEMPIADSEFSHAIYNFMLRWFSKRHECLLTAKQFKQFSVFTAGDLYRFYLLGGTQIFQEQYKNHPLDLSSLTIDSLYSFLINNVIECPIMLLSTEKGDFYSLKARVYETVKQLQVTGLKDAEWSFLALDSLNLKLVPSVMQGSSTKFIIIDCCAQQNIDQLQEIVGSSIHYMKKLILLIDAIQSENLKNLITQISLKHNKNAQVIYIPYFETQLLNTTELKKLCGPYNDKYLNMGGRAKKISEILQNPESGIYQLMRRLTDLTDIISAVHKAESLTQSALPYGVYVPNDLIEGIPHYSLKTLLETVSAELFVIQIHKQSNKNDYIKIFEEWFNNEKEARFAKNNKTTEKEIRYRLVNALPILKDEETYQKSIYLIKKETIPEDIDHVFVEVIDTQNYTCLVKKATGVNLPSPVHYDFSSNKKVNNFSKNTSDNLSILSANAGYGKSAFCLNEFEIWCKADNKNDPMWLVLFNLPQTDLTNPDKLDTIFTCIATGRAWSNWELKAIEHDMLCEDRVIFLLDGLDEIKDQQAMERLNQWIDTLPANVKLLITTRPYAVGKIALPSDRTISNYLTLKEYNEAQHKQYIKQYLTAIFNEFHAHHSQSSSSRKIPDEKIEEISLEIYTKLQAILKRNTLQLLGVPLESYIFCEALKAELFNWFDNAQKIEFDIDLIFEKDIQLNIATLYQRFIKTKLMFFLQKHLELSVSAFTRTDHRLYSLTASYTEIIMIFAAKQAFGLSYDFLRLELQNVYYTSEMLNEISDTGLATIDKHEQEYFLRFNHETYQEYFAAVFLLKNLIKPTNFFEGIDFSKKIYQPQYRMILILAAQLSLKGDPLLPGWNKDHPQQIRIFWKQLCNSEDFLNIATADLLNHCLKSLTDSELEQLRISVNEEEWAGILISQVDDLQKQSNSEEAYSVLSNTQELSQPDDLPFIPQEQQSNTEIKLISVDDKLVKKLKNKNIVFKTTQKALDSGADPKDLAISFAKVIKEVDKVNSYWDIDGGFAAMGLLGNAFSQELADYFIRKIDNDPSYRFKYALYAMSQLAKNSLQSESQKAFLDIVLCLLKNLGKMTRKLEEEHSQFLKLLNTATNLLFMKLQQRLNADLKQITLDNFQLDPSFEKCVFEKAFSTFREICMLAYELKYALIFKEDLSGWFLVGSHVLEFDFDDNEFMPSFKKILRSIVDMIVKEALDKEIIFFDFDDGVWEGFYNNEVKKEYNQFFLSLILKQPDDYKLLYEKNKEKLSILFTTLIESNLMNQAIIDLFTAQLKTTAATGIFSYWSINIGIGLVGQMSHFFNQEMADYLILRAGLWDDNREKAEDALEKIADSLKEAISNDILCDDALKAHDNCTKKMIEELEKKGKSASPKAQQRCQEAIQQLQGIAIGLSMAINKSKDCNNISESDHISTKATNLEQEKLISPERKRKYNELSKSENTSGNQALLFAQNPSNNKPQNKLNLEKQ